VMRQLYAGDIPATLRAEAAGCKHSGGLPHASSCDRHEPRADERWELGAQVNRIDQLGSYRGTEAPVQSFVDDSDQE